MRIKPIKRVGQFQQFMAPRPGLEPRAVLTVRFSMLTDHSGNAS